MLLYNLPVSLRARLGVAFLLLVTSIFAFAESVDQLQPTGYINDFAHVLDPGTRAQMEDICQQVGKKANAQVTVVTINSSDDRDLQEYAVDLCTKCRVGPGKTDRAAPIFYALQH